ncbi:MAG: coiled-coil domain-containing protein [Promethearchaeota archaeon]
MVENIIKTFKLNYDGTFDEIAYENIKDVFTIVNILAIYIQKIKTMYIWIGRNATQALKNHVAQIRVLLKEEFPRFRIIRNITFEMRSEPYEFFKNLKITKDELYEIIEYQEKTVLPVLEKIDDLKERSEKSIESEDFENAIELLKEIIGLAERIQNDALKTEQETLLSELTEKYENQKIVSEIEQETIRIEKEFNKLIRVKNILSAHELVESFREKYEKVYDLTLVPSAKELILKEKKKWKAEQEKIKNDLSILEKDFNESIDNLEISEATKIYDKAMNLISNLIEEKTKNKWEEFHKKIQKAKNKIEFINKFDTFSEEVMKLKETHLYNEIKTKTETLIKEVDAIEFLEYRDKLKVISKEIDSAEELYNKTLEEIKSLEKIIIDNQKNNLLEEVVKDCEIIIELGKSVNKTEVIYNFTNILEQSNEQIKKRKDFKEKQNKLKEELSKLEKQFTLNIKRMEIRAANEVLEKSEKILNDLVDEDIKDKWDNFKTRFHDASRLLENVEFLSKNGIVALDKGSYENSLKFFEQIIDQLQAYKV